MTVRHSMLPALSFSAAAIVSVLHHFVMVVVVVVTPLHGGPLFEGGWE